MDFRMPAFRPASPDAKRETKFPNAQLAKAFHRLPAVAILVSFREWQGNRLGLPLVA